MKRALFILVVLSLALVMVAATKALPNQIRLEIQDALAGEREAIARYERFAVIAMEEGYPGAAALFRAQARAERAHAERFAALLIEHDVPVPAEEPKSIVEGSTRENLRAAAAAERAEREGAYKHAIAACNTHGVPEIAKVFDQTRDSEVEHGNLCEAAVRDLEALKEPKTFYVCEGCGYTMDVKLSYCVLCRSKRAPVAIQ